MTFGGMWEFAVLLHPMTAKESRKVEADGNVLLEKRISDRVREVADDARVATFDPLGDRSQRFLERRFES